MEEILSIKAKWNKGKILLTIPASLEKGEYALRVFQDNSSAVLAYKSTRIESMDQSDQGFECEVEHDVACKKYEIKNIKQNKVVVTGIIELDTEPVKEAITSDQIAGNVISPSAVEPKQKKERRD
jgi:hypothetical protein